MRPGPWDLGGYELPLRSVPVSVACHGGQGGGQGFGRGKHTLTRDGDRILQTASHNHILPMAVLHNRLLLPEVGIAPDIVKGDEDALRLVKPTGASSLGGATGQPFMDGGCPARRAPRFASSGKGGQYPQGESAAICSHPRPRGQAFAMPWG